MRLFIASIYLFAMCACGTAFANSADRPGKTMPLLTAAIATGSGTVYQPWGARRVFQANGLTSAGAGAATVLIEGTLVPSPAATDWKTIATITLTLSTTTSTDGIVVDGPWRYVRARVSAISGTGATVNAYMGTE